MTWSWNEVFNSALSFFANHCNSTSLFSLPTWNKYLDYTHDVNGYCTLGDGFQFVDIWLIAAAILEILIRVGGVLAVVYIIVGGFKFMTSQGSPDATAQARKTIISAIAGLIITVIAASAVSYVATTISGGNSSAFCSQTQTVRINPNDPNDTRTAEVCVGGTELNDTSGASIQRVLNVVYAIAGAVAVIIVVLGGMRFMTSNGDPQRVSSARNTIIYAIVGLVVIVFAYVITGFVLSTV